MFALLFSISDGQTILTPQLNIVLLKWITESFFSLVGKMVNLINNQSIASISNTMHSKFEESPAAHQRKKTNKFASTVEILYGIEAQSQLL